MSDPGLLGAGHRRGPRRGTLVRLAILVVAVLPVVTVAYILLSPGGSGDDETVERVAFWGVGLVALLSVPLFVVVVGALAIWATRRERARRVWRERHGWEDAASTARLAGRWSAPGFAGTAGIEVTEAMWRADERGTVHSFTHLATDSFHVVMTARPAPGPSVHLTPQVGWQRVARSLGGQDLEVESVDFNDRWRVQGTDPRYTHAVLGPRLMQRLMGPDSNDLGVLVEGSDVVVYSPGRTELDRIGAMADLVLDLRDLLPRFAAAPIPPVDRTDLAKSAPAGHPAVGAGGVTTWTGFLPDSGATAGSDVEPGRSWSPGP